MAENTLGYEPQDPSVFATEGDQAAATVPAYVDETEEGKVREKSQKTPSSIAQRGTNSVSVESDGLENDPVDASREGETQGENDPEAEPDTTETPSDPDASEAGGKGAKGA